MKYIIFFALIFSFIFSLPIAAEQPEETQTDIKDFYLITVPKSGSHLIIKLLVMMTHRFPNGMSFFTSKITTVDDNEFEDVLMNCKILNEFPFNHTGKFGHLFENFSKRHPEYLKIFMIRDLRDTILSYVYYINDSLEYQYGPLSFSEKLTRVLDVGNYSVAREFYTDIQAAMDWINREDVLTYRFEELVGSAGGGSDEKLSEAIDRLSSQLGITLSPESKETILKDLFGNSSGPQVSGTFRSGQIGEWKTHFEPEHLSLFKRYWGEYHLKMGYQLND